MRLIRALAPVCASVALMLLAGGCTTVNPYYDSAKPHHTPNGFRNNDGPTGGKPISDLFRWYAERTRDGLPKAPSTHVNGYQFPLVRPDLEWLHGNRSEPSITWIGHATLLVQIAGVNILTDPHFSERAFAVQWLGPRRRVPLTVRLDELPRIDLVVISHSHYDHLDRESVLALNWTFTSCPLNTGAREPRSIGIARYGAGG